MDIATALAADLAGLTGAHDEDGVDLETQLNSVATAVTIAVGSYLDMTVTIAVNGHQVSFTAAAGATTVRAPAGASLLIPLSIISPVPPGSTLVLRAATPGAFIDLAADLSHALGLDPLAFVLDAHLAPTNGSGQGASALEQYSTINQAIGVLLERGHTAASAREGLTRYASLDGAQLHAAAEQVLRTTAPRHAAGDRNGHIARDRGVPARTTYCQIARRKPDLGSS